MPPFPRRGSCHGSVTIHLHVLRQVRSFKGAKPKVEVLFSDLASFDIVDWNILLLLIAQAFIMFVVSGSCFQVIAAAAPKEPEKL